MTIKELENKTGMARANIRFYEGEGLLHPKRLDNGYRDYSEEDARTLEKIKLLRQLQLDIDTIRKVQQGALTLERALFTQLTRLEGDRAVVERAAEVCRELECSGVEYAALDPQPWLRQLEALPASKRELPPPAPQEERYAASRACWHPWQRWLARFLDMILYSTVFRVLWLVLLRDQSILRISRLTVIQWLWGLPLFAFTLAVEPLWLHFWGWTPGKWVFGLKLRDKDGEKLPLAWGLDRSWRLAWDGYGLNIPIYGLWRFWKNRKDALDGWNGSWNDEHACRYTKEERRFSGWVFAGVWAACVAAGMLGIMYTQTPVNRGPLTVEQFAENYNYYFRQLVEQTSPGLPSLGGDGRWVMRESGDNAVVIDLTGNTTRWGDPEFALTDGYVTAVTLHMESRDWMVAAGERELLALLALSGSAEGTDLFRYGLLGWTGAAGEALFPWEDAELDYRGLHISQEVEYSGYLATSDGVLVPAYENVSGHCEKTVTISLIG